MHIRHGTDAIVRRSARNTRWTLATFLLLASLFVVHRARAEGEIAATIVDAHGAPVADAVVVAVPVDGAMRLPARRDSVVDQVDKEFTPKVNAILVGTPVVFPNHDNVRHQVYSFSRAKRFELPLYAGVPAQPIGGAVNCGTASTAMSRAGSKEIARAGCAPAVSRTDSWSNPATTCALVTTNPGRVTNPDPNPTTAPQPSACTCTVLGCPAAAAARTACSAAAGTGGAVTP